MDVARRSARSSFAIVPIAARGPRAPTGSMVGSADDAGEKSRAGVPTGPRGVRVPEHVRVEGVAWRGSRGSGALLIVRVRFGSTFGCEGSGGGGRVEGFGCSSPASCARPSSSAPRAARPPSRASRSSRPSPARSTDGPRGYPDRDEACTGAWRRVYRRLYDAARARARGRGPPTSTTSRHRPSRGGRTPGRTRQE